MREKEGAFLAQFVGLREELVEVALPATGVGLGEADEVATFLGPFEFGDAEAFDLFGEFLGRICGENGSGTVGQDLEQFCGGSFAALLKVCEDFDASAVVGQTGFVINEIPKFRTTLISWRGEASVENLDRRLADMAATSHCLGGDARIGFHGGLRS